ERLGGYYKPLPYAHYRGKMRVELAAAVLEEQRRRRQPAPAPQAATVEVVSQQVGVLKTRMADDMNVTPQKVVMREPLRAESVASGESDDHAIWLDVGQHKHAIEVALSESERHGAVLYDEWDCERGRYRPDWCALRERIVAPGAPDYVDSVLIKHRALVTQIKRQFDALRPEYRRLRKQQDGEDLDLDAIVEAMADQRAGSTPTDSLYIARQANRRDIGVVFLVDLSGSAGGWLRDHRIIDVERESLVLICEALQMLNDRYAIYGFSSSTRKQCDLFLVKDFAEAYNDEVRLRIGGLHTHSYTRMGPPIRHLTRRLDQLDARIKLLMILSDGKPNDFDGYAGRYAVEDTRQALNEARMRSIRTYCLTIDSKAREYLPQMFGENGYSILDDVEKLPARLPDLYRRLTTR
ncbi:MAG: VWA domain-containing protein, partial [Dehalococcoidia bacterium]|nr:VWA domain-containing protein [Dehalococcoidia bacterium]